VGRPATEDTGTMNLKVNRSNAMSQSLSLRAINAALRDRKEEDPVKKAMSIPGVPAKLERRRQVVKKYYGKKMTKEVKERELKNVLQKKIGHLLCWVSLEDLIKIYEKTKRVSNPPYEG